MVITIYGVLFGIAIDWAAAVVIHEGFHWLFIVPFGGSVAGWHVLPQPGWAVVTPSPEPWGTISIYGGGMATGTALLLLLIVLTQRVRQTRSAFWWGCGAAIAFGFPMEIVAGLVEGAFNDFYRNPWFFLFALFAGIAGGVLYWRIIVNRLS